MKISGATQVAGVIGRPVAHSLSPLLHNFWLEAARIDGVYIALSPSEDRFSALIDGLRGGVVRGLNVTAPFKEIALALADRADPAAQSAGAANLLLFHEGGEIEARNTDGVGLLAAFAEQAPMFHVEQGPVVILGAGGAARGAALAFRASGCPDIRIVNRTLDKAVRLAEIVGGRSYPMDDAKEAFADALAIVNATSAGLAGTRQIAWPLDAAPQGAVVMDMIYKPLQTELLTAAEARGMTTVDGLAMLIGQARPSFNALFGTPAPESVNVRALACSALNSER